MPFECYGCFNLPNKGAIWDFVRLYRTWLHKWFLCQKWLNITFCLVWLWHYDWKRWLIPSIYKSKQHSPGKEIQLPVLNAEYFAECLCPVGCLHYPPKTWPSFRLHNLKKWKTQLPPLCFVSCCVTIWWGSRSSRLLAVSDFHAESALNIWDFWFSEMRLF